MTYDARQIVNWFIERSTRDGKALSIMSLLKLTYIAHGWYMETRNTPLFNNRIEAWQHGPVIPDVYNAFRPQGIVPKQVVNDYNSPDNESDQEFLEEIYNIYSDMPPFRLSDLTHVKNGPWDTARQLGGDYAEIPNHLISNHYKLKRASSTKLANELN